MSITIYGIKNCNTMQKAFAWLDKHGITYAFHDYKKSGVTSEKITEWLTKVEIDKLINTKGLTYKKLNEEQKTSMRDQSIAIQKMIEQPSMIKRPIVEYGNRLLLGLNDTEWETALKKSTNHVKA
jgi:Spx/MgsR family transcriptional regulator